MRAARVLATATRVAAQAGLLTMAHRDAALALERDAALAGDRGAALRLLLDLFGKAEAMAAMGAG